MPLAAEAQTAGKVYRIAYLGSMPPSSPQGRSNWEVLLRGLRERSWIEGQNVVIESRYTQGRPERFPELVAEVLRIQVDVIVVADSQAAWTAKLATDTTPIVGECRRCCGARARGQPRAAGWQHLAVLEPARRAGLSVPCQQAAAVSPSGAPDGLQPRPDYQGPIRRAEADEGAHGPGPLADRRAARRHPQRGRRTNPRVFRYIWLAMHTIVRRGSLCHVTKADIDLTTGTIVYRRTKNGSRSASP